MNRITNQSTWQRNYDTVDKPLAKFAGGAAQAQLADFRGFVNEQLVGSKLYDVKPWPEVLKHPRVESEKFEQCQLGQKNSNGDPVMKPTELVVSDLDLVYYFMNLKCGRFPSRCSGKSCTSYWS